MSVSLRTNITKLVTTLLFLQGTLTSSVWASDFSFDNTAFPQPHLTADKKQTEYETRSDTAEKWLFHQFPSDLGHDMVESFWGWGGVAFIIGSGLVAGLHTQDDEIQSHFIDHPLFGATGDDIFGVIGNPLVLGGASLITWGIGSGIKDQKLKLTGESFVESLLLAETITGLGKVAFRRERPNGDSFSFPSAHTSGAFAMASVLQVFYGFKAGIPAYALASIIGLSRIDDNAHWASDVAMGAVIGGVIGWGTATLHKKKYLPFAISPSVTQGGYSLNVSSQF